MWYALDTTHASAVLREDAGLTRRVSIARELGARFHLPMPVVAELYFMVWKSARPSANLQRFLPLLSICVLLDFDHAAAVEFGEIRAALSAAGAPIPVMDAQIAAISRLHNLVLLTADGHFSRVQDLVVENWLSAD